MTDHNTSELARVKLAIVRNAVAIAHTENAIQAMRTPTDLRLRRADRFAEAVWWIVYFACMGVLAWGLLSL